MLLAVFIGIGSLIVSDNRTMMRAKPRSSVEACSGIEFGGGGGGGRGGGGGGGRVGGGGGLRGLGAGVGPLGRGVVGGANVIGTSYVAVNVANPMRESMEARRPVDFGGLKRCPLVLCERSEMMIAI
jgi:hypothetical protein